MTDYYDRNEKLKESATDLNLGQSRYKIEETTMAEFLKNYEKIKTLPNCDEYKHKVTGSRVRIAHPNK